MFNLNDRVKIKATGRSAKIIQVLTGSEYQYKVEIPVTGRDPLRVNVYEHELELVQSAVQATPEVAPQVQPTKVWTRDEFHAVQNIAGPSLPYASYEDYLASRYGQRKS